MADTSISNRNNGTDEDRARWRDTRLFMVFYALCLGSVLLIGGLQGLFILFWVTGSAVVVLTLITVAEHLSNFFVSAVWISLMILGYIAVQYLFY